VGTDAEDARFAGEYRGGPVAALELCEHFDCRFERRAAECRRPVFAVVERDERDGIAALEPERRCHRRATILWPMTWGERAQAAIERYRGGEARDLDQRQLTQLGNAAWAAGLCLLMD